MPAICRVRHGPLPALISWEGGAGRASSFSQLRFRQRPPFGTTTPTLRSKISPPAPYRSGSWLPMPVSMTTSDDSPGSDDGGDGDDGSDSADKRNNSGSSGRYTN